ncbi:zinc finger, CCHC-type containing protein [Tanacetum coccineum]
MVAAAMSVVYVLTTPILEDDGDDPTMEQQIVVSIKELWDSLEAKYMAEDASSKKFIVSNFTDYKMTDSRPVMEQYNKLLGIFGRFTQHKMNMDETIHISCIIDKLSSSWKNFKHTLKHKKEELTLVELGSHLRIEESLRALNIVNNIGKSAFMPTFKLNDSITWAVVRLLDPKLKTLGERGIECIFVGYAEHSKAFRFYVIEPNDSVSINSIIESRDAIFDENRFSSVPRPSLRIPNRTEDIGGSVVPEEVTEEVVQQPEPELRKSKRNRTPKDFGPEFQLYLIEGTRDEVSDQHSYCFNVEDDPKTFDEAMKSQDVAFWKEAINDEMDSIMGNNTWVLTDLPPGCRPLGCKWIFKRKLKVDGTVEKFKARLVIQGFKQKSGIDYFDTYAPVARISTIRLLIAMASIHSLIIHQMDVKTAFLNGELEEEVYMNQPLGFILPGNENKVCKLIKSLYGLKQAPKQWHQKFDEVVLSNGYLLNQADKCVYSKFDASGKGVIICLYVDDMLIFGTDQVQVDLTKEFLSSRFSMKDMGEADVILGIRIKHESNGIAISQSHYIEKVLKKFNYSDCTPVSTPLDTCEKLMPNRGLAVSQLEYSRVIGCLMYAMTCTRPDIAFAVGKLSRYTSNPGTQHWQAIQRVLKYLKKTIDYRLVYSGYPSVLEGYTDASWISNTKDNSSISGWVFLLGSGAISWASKKQTCITGSTMESEFVALAAAGKEAEWLKNLLLEIPMWVKPMTPIYIYYDSATTLVKAYSQMYNGKSKHLGVRHSMIRMDVLGTCCKEDEVVNFLMVNFFEKVLSMSMNKDESPMYSNGLKGSILRTP